MSELETLQAEARRIGQRIDRLQTQQRAAENRALIGSCFKYRNSYSCSEKPSDYWWLYLRVTGTDGSGNLKVLEFQTDKYGEVTIKPARIVWSRLSDGYRPIKQVEFNKAWRAVQKRIAGIKP